jgi:hypothetical protein
MHPKEKEMEVKRNIAESPFTSRDACGTESLRALGLKGI